jgi:transcription initiation factor TFIIIB Brf1 subunit/transcription initiation factor TFIIB
MAHAGRLLEFPSFPIPSLALAAASVFIACRKEGYPRTFKDIAKNTSVPVKDLGRAYQQLRKIVKLDTQVTRATALLVCGNNPRRMLNVAGWGADIETCAPPFFYVIRRRRTVSFDEVNLDSRASFSLQDRYCDNLNLNHLRRFAAHVSDRAYETNILGGYVLYC